MSNQFSLPQHTDVVEKTSVQNIIWRDVTVTARRSGSKDPKVLLDGVSGIVEAGQCCAIMGPSGSGKTILLDRLSGRPTGAHAAGGEVLVNGHRLSQHTFRSMSCFVEHEDSLLGSLTVLETVLFAARLANKHTSAKDQKLRCAALLEDFGLSEQADLLIGTAFRRGISDGQKRRLSIVSQLITNPSILFLDEPTSGLDSAASFEVINYLAKVAKRTNLIVVCSIHQPSSATLNIFDKVTLLSRGAMHYFGPTSKLVDHYDSLNVQLPPHVNPAEFFLDTLNTDFAKDQAEAIHRVSQLRHEWKVSRPCLQLQEALDAATASPGPALAAQSSLRPGVMLRIWALLRCAFVKSYRDAVVYGVRLAMYTLLAISMGTLWLHLKSEQSYIQPFLSAIIVSIVFMAYSSLAYIPAYIEDYHQFVKARRNGLYGPFEFLLSNLIIGVPYMALFSLFHSSINYWLSSLTPTASAFFTWVLFSMLNLVVSESETVFLASLFPNFVVALGLRSVTIILWVASSGVFMVPSLLNAFYTFFRHFDYLRYVFDGMMETQFRDRVFTCGANCQCMYPSALASQCKIAGEVIIDAYGVDGKTIGQRVAILIALMAAFRLATFLGLVLKR